MALALFFTMDNGIVEQIDIFAIPGKFKCFQLFSRLKITKICVLPSNRLYTSIFSFVSGKFNIAIA